MKVLVDRDKKLSDSFTHSLTHSPYNISNIYIFIVIYCCYFNRPYRLIDRPAFRKTKWLMGKLHYFIHEYECLYTGGETG